MRREAEDTERLLAMSEEEFFIVIARLKSEELKKQIAKKESALISLLD